MIKKGWKKDIQLHGMAKISRLNIFTKLFNDHHELRITLMNRQAVCEEIKIDFKEIVVTSSDYSLLDMIIDKCEINVDQKIDGFSILYWIIANISKLLKQKKLKIISSNYAMIEYFILKNPKLILLENGYGNDSLGNDIFYQIRQIKDQTIQKKILEIVMKYLIESRDNN